MPHKPRKKVRKRSRIKRHPPTVSYLLEHATLQEMRNNKKTVETLLQYHWSYYHDLAYQRKQVEDQLIRILNEACVSNFKFQNWQRAVKYKYSNHPLSTLGSLQMPGGRFNIGQINPLHFAPFPGLYIASDKATALQESLIPNPVDVKIKLSPLELALTDRGSITIVSVGGSLERCLDLRDANSLCTFIELINNFKISESITHLADINNIERPRIVKSCEELLKSLMDKNWRLMPMQYDIPANSQIFGQLAHSAGIDGILYKSIATNKDCLVIYPRNFENSSSYIQIDDELPDNNIPKRLDTSCWKISESSS